MRCHIIILLDIDHPHTFFRVAYPHKIQISPTPLFAPSPTPPPAPPPPQILRMRLRQSPLQAGSRQSAMPPATHSSTPLTPDLLLPPRFVTDHVSHLVRKTKQCVVLSDCWTLTDSLRRIQCMHRITTHLPSHNAPRQSVAAAVSLLTRVTVKQ